MQEPKQIALELNQLFEMLNRDKLLGPNMRHVLCDAHGTPSVTHCASYSVVGHSCGMSEDKIQCARMREQSEVKLSLCKPRRHASEWR